MKEHVAAIEELVGGATAVAKGSVTVGDVGLLHAAVRRRIKKHEQRSLPQRHYRSADALDVGVRLGRCLDLRLGGGDPRRALFDLRLGFSDLRLRVLYG